MTEVVDNIDDVQTRLANALHSAGVKLLLHAIGSRVDVADPGIARWREVCGCVSVFVCRVCVSLCVACVSRFVFFVRTADTRARVGSNALRASWRTWRAPLAATCGSR